MAWNPSPEIAHARDFGNKFGWDQVIILHHNTATGQTGYASYGKTRRLCDDAKTLADVAFDAMILELAKR